VPKPPLKALLIDSRDDRAAMVRHGLSAFGEAELTVIDHLEAIPDATTRITPDVVILTCRSPGPDLLESLRRVARNHPIVMFVEDGTPELARRAVECGVSAYVVAGLAAERVCPVVEVAMQRFRLFHTLKAELEKTRSDLAARKTIERAKGLLMQERQLSEDAAYGLLRRFAMNEGRSIPEVAESLLSAARLLKK